MTSLPIRSGRALESFTERKGGQSTTQTPVTRASDHEFEADAEMMTLMAAAAATAAAPAQMAQSAAPDATPADAVDIVIAPRIACARWAHTTRRLIATPPFQDHVKYKVYLKDLLEALTPRFIECIQRRIELVPGGRPADYPVDVYLKQLVCIQARSVFVTGGLAPYDLFATCLVWIDRAKELAGEKLTPERVNQVVLTLLCLGNKFHCDDGTHYDNAAWAKWGGLPVGEVNRLERDLLIKLEHTLWISKEEQLKYVLELVNGLPAEEGAAPLAPGLGLTAGSASASASIPSTVGAGAGSASTQSTIGAGAGLSLTDPSSYGSASIQRPPMRVTRLPPLSGAGAALKGRAQTPFRPAGSAGALPGTMGSPAGGSSMSGAAGSPPARSRSVHDSLIIAAPEKPKRPWAAGRVRPALAQSRSITSQLSTAGQVGSRPSTAAKSVTQAGAGAALQTSTLVVPAAATSQRAPTSRQQAGMPATLKLFLAELERPAELQQPEQPVVERGPVMSALVGALQVAAPASILPSIARAAIQKAEAQLPRLLKR
jgi:hypothetical protein